MKKLLSLILLLCATNAVAHQIKNGRVVEEDFYTKGKMSTRYCEVGKHCIYLNSHHKHKFDVQPNISFNLPKLNH
jgi:hypothetical protein